MIQLLSQFKDYSLPLLRIFTGFMFLQHGAQKLFGAFGGFMGKEGASAPLFSAMSFAGILEFFGGLAILIGLLTRPIAFILSGQMAAAYFLAHLPSSFWTILNKGELAVLYCFIFLLLATHGSGKFSVDQLIREKGTGPAS